MAVFFRFQDSGLDDWKKSKNYVQIGFRPGFAIQAREMTQMQTIFQNQLNALAQKMGMVSGSLLSPVANVVMTRGTGQNFSLSINPSDFWIQPTLRDFGYVVSSNDVLQLNSFSVDPNSGDFIIYLITEETQVNPNGQEFPPQGGFAGVKVDESLNDNAQGFTNSNAPGGSRYAINIIGIGTRIEGEGTPPPNTVDFIRFTNGNPYYAADGLPVTY